MKVQKFRSSDGRESWLVLDDNYLAVQPILSYLRYLDKIERSPNTIKSYAGHLKLFWEYLRDSKLDWKNISSLETMADFISWLRKPDPRVVSIQPQEAKRSERTINVIVTAVCSFYDFQFRLGNIEELKVYSQHLRIGDKRFKPFLEHVMKGKPVQKNLLKLKEPKTFPGTLTHEQVQQLITACTTQRSKLLIYLLYETGMRIGQAIGLRHSDVRSWDNEISITPRNDNANGARAKCKDPYIIHVSRDLIKVYSDYLLNEYPEDVDSDYVFINIWDGKVGKPITYSTVNELFRQLHQKTGIKANPHLLRHTHATELILGGWDMAHVQKRLGHASIQTTMDTYIHLKDDDMRKEYKIFLDKRGKD